MIFKPQYRHRRDRPHDAYLHLAGVRGRSDQRACEFDVTAPHAPLSPPMDSLQRTEHGARRSHRRVVITTCQAHGAVGFTNLLVTREDGIIVLNPHAANCCVLRLDEQAATGSARHPHGVAGMTRSARWVLSPMDACVHLIALTGAHPPPRRSPGTMRASAADSRPSTRPATPRHPVRALQPPVLSGLRDRRQPRHVRPFPVRSTRNWRAAAGPISELASEPPASTSTALLVIGEVGRSRGDQSQTRHILEVISIVANQRSIVEDGRCRNPEVICMIASTQWMPNSTSLRFQSSP
jgi:hypothetical protein